MPCWKDDALCGPVEDAVQLGHVECHFRAVGQKFLGTVGEARPARAARGSRAVTFAFSIDCRHNRRGENAEAIERLRRSGN